MTDAEFHVLTGFLVAGFAAGLIGRWLDMVTALFGRWKN